jgi:hypothetical protein
MSKRAILALEGGAIVGQPSESEKDGLEVSHINLNDDAVHRFLELVARFKRGS